jgi:hypothetical protein
VAAFREGKIASILSERHDLVRATVASDEGEIEAAGFTSMLGPLKTGDRVIVNTTGMDLELGTGGVGFILWNLDGPGPEGVGAGHIVKLRYTPWQTEVLAAEAPESRHHDSLREADSIDGIPVVVCSLHSQVAAVAAGVKAAVPTARVGYLMTDGAALPIAWSDLVDELKKAELLDVTCTAGHAFGGDLESVNVFSGLVALRVAGRADVIVAAMGPGVVGTSSALGFTGMEQGQILDAATALGGRAIACLRVNFAETRPRHRGLSHHNVTALRIAARERCTVAVPELPDGRSQEITAALQAAGIPARHEIVAADGGPGIKTMRARGVTPTSMGRTLDEVPELFLAGAAAGALAASWL